MSDQKVAMRHPKTGKEALIGKDDAWEYELLGWVRVEKIDEPSFNIRDVHVYSWGLLALCACAPSNMPLDHVTVSVNFQHPTGISSEWSPADDERFATGSPNPGPCERDPNRTHYLFYC